MLVPTHTRSSNPSPSLPLVSSAPMRCEARRGEASPVGGAGAWVRGRGAVPERRLIGLLGGGAMAMEDAVAEADLADPNPDVGDLFHHYDSLYFQGALAAAGFTVQWTSSLPFARRLGFSSSWLLLSGQRLWFARSNFKAAPFRAVRRWCSAS